MLLDYDRVNWDIVKESGSQVLLIDVNHPVGVRVLDNVDRQELLTTDQYITHDSNKYGRNGNVYIYDITKRAIDNMGNLILFVKTNSITYTR